MQKVVFILILIAFLVVPCYSVPIVISTGSPVTVSSVYSSYVGSNLTDGNINVGWNASTYSGWAQIDLGTPSMLAKAIYYAGATSSTETFSLYIDNVLIETKTLYIPVSSIIPVEFDFADRLGRYVQINISAASSWVYGAEFEIYGELPEPSTWIFLGLALGFIAIKKI